MPNRLQARAAARCLVSLAVLSGIGLERRTLAGEPAGRSGQAKVAPKAAAKAPEAEGIVHIWRAPEPEGVVSLRHVPYVGQWIAWLVPNGSGGGFPIAPAPLAASPRPPAGSDEGPVSPEAIRRRLMETIQGPSRPVVVAPLDSCTPIDVGRIEDLIFPDPQTADRIIRAAGQGFRVVTSA